MFVMIFLAVALFGALMFTFSRGARQGTDDLSERQANVAASDILAYTQQIERAVSRVYRRGFSESAISFDNSFVSGYANADCGGDERCEIFSAGGGAARFRNAESAWSLSNANWVFNGENQVIGIGDDCADDSCVELLMILADLPITLCQVLNERLELAAISDAPLTDSRVDVTGQYTGAFDYDANFDIGDETTAAAGRRTACIYDTTNARNVFYHTLLER